MAFNLPCPICGLRPVAEFKFGGEAGPESPPGPDLKGLRRDLYLQENLAGVQEEWWFHTLGCGRWLRVERDSATNTVTRAEVC